MKKHKNPNNKSLPPNRLHHVTLVDVVIAVYGRFDLLEKCLEALPGAMGEIPYNTILVDNASPDRAEADAFYAKHPEAIIIRNKENLGFPRASNQGARRKNSPLILFLNSDCIMQAGSIDAMVRVMDDPKVGVVGAKLLYPLDSTDPNRPAGKVQHVGMAIDIHGHLNHMFMGWSPDHPKVRKMGEVLAVTGASFMTRRILFNKIGGFDEVYGLGTHEDCDFCFSVAGLGYKVKVCQGAVGYHYTSATALQYGVRFPMTLNQSIFTGKWGKALTWTDWLYW